MDINRNGQYEDGIEPLLGGWNITVYDTGGGFTGFYNITDSSGLYTICGLPTTTQYNVSEVLPGGWFRSTPYNVTIDWINSSYINQNETLFAVPGQQGDPELQNFMPPPQTLFGVESRYGSGDLQPPREMELFNVQNQVYTDATHTINQTNIAWGNTTVYDFNMTFFPNGTVYYTVGNVVISGDVFNPSGGGGLSSQNWPLEVFAIRLRSIHDASRVDLTNLKLTVNGRVYPLQNSTLNATYPTNQRETLFVRAQPIMNLYYGGGDAVNISKQGFSITGKQEFTFSSASNNKPNSHELEYSIYLGRASFPTTDQQFANFGNYNNSGILQGQKWDDVNGNGIKDPGDTPLPGWHINVKNTTLGINETLLTDGNGEWAVLVPFGIYQVSEETYANFNQTYPAGKTYTIDLNASVFTGQNFGIENIDFGNQEIPQVGNISGIKYNDFNQNGHYDPVIDVDPDDNEQGIPAWNISLYYENGTYTGISQLTNANGTYLFQNLDANKIYIVKEESLAGWYNSTPTQLIADFKNTTEYPNESVVDTAVSTQLLPVQNIAFAVRSLWGETAGYHQDIEWSPFALINSTRNSTTPHWLNNTEYTFTLTYNPATPSTAINYTVTGPPTKGFTTTTILGAADINGSRADPMDIIDIYTRANVNNAVTVVEVSNLTLKSGSNTYTITNNSVASSIIIPSQTHLIVRANRVLGANITQGFTLTGTQKFIYPTPSTPIITGSGFAVQINVGKDNLTPTDVIEEFGNYQHVGEVEGSKFSDDNGNSVWDVANFESPLEFWTINLRYKTNGTLFRSNVTDEEGEYEFYLPYGDYHVEEVAKAGYNQTLGKAGYDITIGDGSSHITGKNFGNQYIEIFNVTGTKFNDLNGNGVRDPGEPGLAGWTIGIGNVTIPYFNSTTTDSTGNFRFINVPKANYTVNETLQAGWKNTTALEQTACAPPFPYLPPIHLETTAVDAYFLSGGTPVGSDYAYLRSNITGVNPTMGYDIQNTAYPGWCGDTTHIIQTSTAYDVWSFVDSSPPFSSGLISNFPTVATSPWDKINYVLNRRPYYGSLWGTQNTSQIVQVVIWNYTNGIPVDQTTGGISLNPSQQADALQILADADTHGSGYSPPCGGVKAIFLNISAEDYGLIQLTMIEVPVRCCLPAGFGNQELGSIYGYKNNSATGAGLSGWNITLSNSTTGFIAWNITNGTGGYSIGNIPQGTYWLNETPQAGFTQSPGTPNRTVTIDSSNLVLSFNFTNTPLLGKVSGYKVNPQGAGLNGWTMVMWNQTLGTYTNVTNSTGGFTISDIPWGIYQLGEVNQPGWTQSTANISVEINGTSLVLTGQNITNTQQLGNVSGYKVNSQEPG